MPPNASFDLYAILRGSTAQDRKVDFTISFVTLNSLFSVKVAHIKTGVNAISLIDNTQRDLISFEALIEEKINNHKHRGTPSKIDLKSETKNQLPGARVDDFDASKISTGNFDIGRMPQVDHNDLLNNGILTHAQLDSFVNTLSQNNKELLGEVSSVNLLKSIIFLKYKYSDVDEHFINELALIPGISPNSFIDFESSTANINLQSKCISGLPALSGQFLSILWDDRSSFTNAHKLTNLSVSDDSVILTRDEEDVDVIDNYETVSVSGESIPGYSITTETIADSLSIKSENADTLKTEGFFSGKFSTQKTIKALYTKEFTAKDWSRFNQLVINVKTNSVKHGAVYVIFVNTVDEVEIESTIFTILSDNEVTSNVDSSLNNFATKIFDISSEAKNSVNKFIIFTEDTDSGFEFYLDNIYVRNRNLFLSQGTIKLRYSSSAPVNFHSLFYDIDNQSNTSSIVKVRVANSDSLLSRAEFVSGLRSGDIFSLDGTNIEIDITLLTDDLTVTPVLNSVELRLLVDSDVIGFDIDSQDDWLLGDLDHTEISSDNIVLPDPINVGGLYFTTKDFVSEIDDDNSAVFGFSGSKMPISPAQAFEWVNTPRRGFDNAVSCVRQFNQKYIVSDNRNNRVLEVDSSGNLVRGIGSVGVVDTSFYPLVANYNPENSVLTIILSLGIEKEFVDLTKFIIYISGTKLHLNSLDTILDNQKSDQILEIQLSSEKSNLLLDVTENVTIDFSSNAFPVNISLNERASALTGAFGIECFIGNFKYVDFISHPVYSNILSNNNWIVCNSAIEVGEFFDNTGTSSSSSSSASSISSGSDVEISVPSVVEFDFDTEEIDFSSSVIFFSDYSLGSAIETGSNKIAVAGIFFTDTALETQPLISQPQTAREKFLKSAVENLAKARGTVLVIDKNSGNTIFNYVSPDGLYPSSLDLNSSGNIVVAESSFSGPGGRVIILDSFGNIIWVYGSGNFNVINSVRSGENGLVLSL